MMPDSTNAMFLGLNNWENGRGERREQKDKEWNTQKYRSVYNVRYAYKFR